MSKRLMRVWYDTDATDNEPEYPGTLSDPIADRAFENAFVVDVDWSKRGTVQVTYLIDVELGDE